jgi:hypothetical protein
MGMLAASLLVKQQLGHEVDQLPISVADINVWIFASTVLCTRIFMTWCLIKQAQG